MHAIGIDNFDSKDEIITINSSVRVNSFLILVKDQTLFSHFVNNDQLSSSKISHTP